jgi:hypothetical protein
MRAFDGHGGLWHTFRFADTFVGVMKEVRMIQEVAMTQI